MIETMRATLEKLAMAAFKAIARLQSPFDKKFVVGEIPVSDDISHRNWQKYIYQLGNVSGLRILEIGSREVTGPSSARKQFAQAEYVGFDYYPGPNVDVVGDAHRLSSYFPAGEQFDLIYTTACFEHFAMPWVVAEEIAKVLKVGGLLFVETHFSFSAHERPWNFFQFSDMGLRVLFSKALGFECIESVMSNPIVGRFSALADDYLRYRPVRGLYCHSEYLGRKVREVSSFEWKEVDLAEVVNGTSYPKPRR
jgi:SAM-dependent methyltransferase